MTVNITTDIIFQYAYDYVSTPGTVYINGMFNFADPGLALQNPAIFINGTIGATSNYASNIYTSPADMASYNGSLATIEIINYFNANQSVFNATAGSVIYVDEATQMALQTKQNAIATGSSSQYLKGDLTLGTSPKVYNGITLRATPVEYTGTGTVSSGSVVFYLTSDGTSTGAALFPNSIDFMTATVSSTTTQYGFSFTLSNSNKTLTIGVSAITSVLGILGISTAVNGTSINIFVKGS